MAIVKVYATTTGFSASASSPRLRAMAGSAVLTIVVSSVCMKKQAATTQSRACCDEGLAMDESYCANANGRLTAGRRLGRRCACVSRT
ncbi:hypothetical protein G6F46_014405 [Rhizopus delemar]|nr:hypothetical protein G6F24_018741 [Rhizopus arrhizus]KAG1595949.1 hypothetical protein G6F46_014405 [Rhizopus delemar]